jgi:hypothetical protein
MKINQQTIQTPLDDPITYNLEWRHRVAVAAYDPVADRVQIPPRLANDHDLRDYAAHVRSRSRHPLGERDPPRPFDRIELWHGQPTGRLVTAYLLTAATYPEIATDTGLAEEELRLYGRLFFDVRDQQGQRLRGVLTRLRMEMADLVGAGDTLMRTALTAGLTGLRTALGAVEAVGPHDLVGCLVEQELARRVVSGRMRDADLIRLQANGVMRERIAAQTQGGGHEVQETMEMALGMLRLTAPHMVSTDQTAEKMVATTTAIKGRIESQLAASGMPVRTDALRGEATLDRLVKTQLGRKG